LRKRDGKTALQFRHNGRDVAVFVDGGVNSAGDLARSRRRYDSKFGSGGRMRRLYGADATAMRTLHA